MMGILSYQGSFALQLKQWESGFTTLMPSGILNIHTFPKLPNIAPITKNKMEYKTKGSDTIFSPKNKYGQGQKTTTPSKSINICK